MYIRKILKPNNHVSIRIVQSVRRGNKVKQETYCCVGHAHKDDVKKIDEFYKFAEELIIKRNNERAPALPGMEDIVHAPVFKKIKQTQEEKEEKINFKTVVEEKRINNGIDDIFGTNYRQLGFGSIFEENGVKANEHEVKDVTELSLNSILKDVVISRIADPLSKRKTSKILERDYDKKVPLQKIYRMMDKLAKKDSSIKKLVTNNTLTLFDKQVDVLFFDVTTLYFESIESDELRDNGYSKDCKFKEVQVVLALVTTTEGLPIYYKEFPGNLSEGKTLLTMVTELKEQHPNIRDVVLVADRAMFSEENLQLMESLKVNYAVAAKLRRLPKDIKNKICSDQFRPTVVENEFQWVTEYGYKETNRRLIVSYSSKRAKKDRADRERLIERLIKKEKSGKINVNELVTNRGSRKFITRIEGKVEINITKIEEDEKWDGLHGIITNVHGATAESLLARYRGLWQIEAAFRINKHDLKMRPIFHWKPHRIKAHLLICYLAYSLISTVMFKLKNAGLKISFEELRDELIRVESSILRDKCSRKRFLLPSSATELQYKIYQSLGLVRETRVKRFA